MNIFYVSIWNLSHFYIIFYPFQHSFSPVSTLHFSRFSCTFLLIQLYISPVSTLDFQFLQNICFECSSCWSSDQFIERLNATMIVFAFRPPAQEKYEHFHQLLAQNVGRLRKKKIRIFLHFDRLHKKNTNISINLAKNFHCVTCLTLFYILPGL